MDPDDLFDVYCYIEQIHGTNYNNVKLDVVYRETVQIRYLDKLSKKYTKLFSHCLAILGYFFAVIHSCQHLMSYLYCKMQSFDVLLVRISSHFQKVFSQCTSKFKSLEIVDNFTAVSGSSGS